MSGDIVTVNDAQLTAEAVAVKDGRSGGRHAPTSKAHTGAATTVVDLRGAHARAGFSDAHAHVPALWGPGRGANSVAAPDGKADTIDDPSRHCRSSAKGPRRRADRLIFGMGDDALLGRHPTRDDLTRCRRTFRPSRCTSRGTSAPEQRGAREGRHHGGKLPDPEGGVIRRRPGSREPNGVLEELASFPVMIAAISPPNAGEANDY